MARSAGVVRGVSEPPISYFQSRNSAPGAAKRHIRVSNLTIHTACRHL
jgi:hypothetical protein